MGNEQTARGAGGVLVHNPDVRSCAFCGKQGKLRKCSGCLAVAYCSKQCQKTHWGDHKQVCKKVVHVAAGRHQHKTFAECFGACGTDFHAWHEVDGKVYGLAAHCGVADLPDGDKQYPAHFTLRKKYKRKLAGQLKAYSLDGWEKYMRAKEVEGGLGDVGSVLKQLEPVPHFRVFALMHFFPDHFTDKTLRFGSLGYRNADGSAFWEYG
jgi:hypothetical protein